MRGLLLAFACFRIVSGAAIFAFALSAGNLGLAAAAFFLMIGFLTRLSMIAALVLCFLEWNATRSGFFFPVLICFGSGGNRLSVDRLIAIVRGKERADPSPAPRADALDVYFDGECVFCRRSVELLKALDLRGALRMRDFRVDPASDIDPARAEKELLLRTRDGRILGGFWAFREMSKRLPLTFLIWPFLYLPGVPWIGERVYAWVADHRLLLMGRAQDCESGTCALTSQAPEDRSKITPG